jgi:hypothetical protein
MDFEKEKKMENCELRGYREKRDVCSKEPEIQEWEGRELSPP